MKRNFIVIVASALLLAMPLPSIAQDNKTETSRTAPSRKNTCTVTFGTNMHCENCKNKIASNLQYMKGVKGLEISLEEQTIKVDYDTSKTSEEKLAEAVKKLGYKAEKMD